jgi:2-haloacid dehalogenase
MGQDVIAFDLNGTLLDMGALDLHFQRIFAASGFREKWFEQLQNLWMTTIACGTFEPFEKLAKASLRMLAAKESVELASADETAVLKQMTNLPPYADVPPALSALRKSGYRLVALTNGARKSARMQLKNAGIASAFDEIFAADQVERYKPAPEPYRFVTKQLKIKPKKLLFVAAHAWDIQGAYQAGLQTVFLRRPRQVLNPLGTKPDYEVRDMAALAEKFG